MGSWSSLHLLGAASVRERYGQDAVKMCFVPLRGYRRPDTRCITATNRVAPMIDQRMGNDCPSTATMKGSGSPNFPAIQGPIRAPIKPRAMDTTSPPRALPAMAFPTDPHTAAITITGLLANRRGRLLRRLDRCETSPTLGLPQSEHKRVDVLPVAASRTCRPACYPTCTAVIVGHDSAAPSPPLAPRLQGVECGAPPSVPMGLVVAVRALGRYWFEIVELPPDT